MGDHLSALDATFLELEQVDDSAHMHIGGVMVFDPRPHGRAPSLREVREDLSARLPKLPRWTQRLSTPRTGGLSWPAWEEHSEFDIADHVSIATLPAPRGERELLEWAGAYYSERLDRSRPLWEVVVLELADGRWAMVTKTHHCMVDGVGSVDLAQLMLDPQPAAPRRSSNGDETARSGDSPPARSREPKAGASPPARLVRGAGEVGMGLALIGVRAAREVLRLGADTAVHPKHARDALAQAKATAELLVRDELIPAPRTSLNRPIGPERRLAVVDVPLADLKQVKRGLGGTINDVVLAMSTYGLRRLLLERGEPVPEHGMRAMVPVNVRSAADRLAAGNVITSLFVDLPVAEPDPARCYAHQTESAEALKAGTQALGSTSLMELTSLAPPVIHSLLARSLYATRLFNVTITNVPGPQLPLYAFGSRLRSAWPLVPLAAEHALGIAIFSYDGRAFFCVNADRDSVPDLDVVVAGMEAALQELVELGREREGSSASRS